MSLRSSDGSDERFSIYVEGLASVIGHADRVNPLRDYCTGLMMPCARKSVEPMAAVTRQYCGQLGKQDNCQAAVSLSIANRQASLPVRYRLYLPQEWADDAARRRRAYVPEEIVFETKPEIALEQRWACKAGLPRGVVLLDAGYGNHTNLRTQIGALGLSYAAGILSNSSVWAPGTKPLPPKRWSGRGRPPTRPRRSAKHKPVSVKQLALALPRRAWQTIGWREGSAAPLSSRFARVRVRAAHRGKLHAEEWLLIEWPKGDQILALHTAAGHRLRAPGRSGQAALAHATAAPPAFARRSAWLTSARR